MVPPRSRLVDLWDRLKSSYWFVPAVMFVGALLLAYATFRVDLYLELTDSLDTSPWFPKFEADASRAILSTLASGMLTVTGVVFSLAVVALQLASSQFGPRLLRTFMTSTGTQIVLGAFTSSFVYFILVMGTVRGEIGFVPQVSTATGIVIGVIDIAVLIYFVHHLATSIRVETLLATLVDDLREVLDALFPSELGEQAGASSPAAADWQQITGGERIRKIPALGAGYVRRVDADMLMSTAEKHDLVLRVEIQPGAFVLEGTRLLSAWPDGRICDGVETHLRESIVLGPGRTPMQDAGFAIRQLVEIALRALSPGINDPFTAVECTNRLAEALCCVARRHRPSAQRRDDHGRLRVIAEPMSLAGMADAAFTPIARAGGGNADVAVRVVEAIVAVATCARQDGDRRFLLDFAGELEEQIQAQLPNERDRRFVRRRFQAAAAAAQRQAPSAGSHPATADEATPLALEGDAA